MRSRAPNVLVLKWILRIGLLIVLAAHAGFAASSPSNANSKWGRMFSSSGKGDPEIATSPAKPQSTSDEDSDTSAARPQSDGTSNARLQKEQLYEAYNMLHSLAQVIWSDPTNI